MSLAFDESGRPFIILREQQKKKRTKGLEAHKVSFVVILCNFEYYLLDQHPCCRHSSKSLENFPRSKRYGQNAGFTGW